MDKTLDRMLYVLLDGPSMEEMGVIIGTGCPHVAKLQGVLAVGEEGHYDFVGDQAMVVLCDVDFRHVGLDKNFPVDLSADAGEGSSMVSIEGVDLPGSHLVVRYNPDARVGVLEAIMLKKSFSYPDDYYAICSEKETDLRQQQRINFLKSLGVTPVEE